MQNLPLVIDYLKTHTFQQLEKEHAVKARPCPEHKKFSLNYDQIRVDDKDQLASQCRGLIIRPNQQLSSSNYDSIVVGDVDVVCWPMNRFFNHGDPAAAELDWSFSKTTIFEKLDGTACFIYFDYVKCSWCVATRSMPEANLQISNDGFMIEHTFASLFKHALCCTLVEVENLRIKELGCEKNDQDIIFQHWAEQNLFKGYTYVFELTTPLNRVVVKYDNYRVTLLAIRDSQGCEKSIDDSFSLKGNKVLKVKKWEYNDVKGLVEFLNSSDPSEVEGAVLIDDKFNRVKVKNVLWVLASRAKSMLFVSKKNVLKSIIDGTFDDIKPLLYADAINEVETMKNDLNKFLIRLNDSFNSFVEQSFNSRKTFANYVNQNSIWPAPYFQLLDGKYGKSAFDWIQKIDLTDQTLENILKSMRD